MEGSSFLNPALVIQAAHLHEGMRVADFGSGSGFFARAAARSVGEEGSVWAVEATQELLSRRKNLALAEGVHNVAVVRGDIEAHSGSNVPAESFDLVIIANVLFYLADKKACVHEARRVLKRHGRVLVIDWRASFGGLGPHPEHVVTERDAKKIFEEEGFAHIEDMHTGAY